MKNSLTAAITVLAFPVILTIGIFLIPVVSDYTNHQIAEAAVQMEFRWFLGHIIAALAFAWSILSVFTVTKFINFKVPWQPHLFIPMVVIGAGFYAAGLGADGIGPLAVQSAGFSPVIFFDGSGIWVTSIFVIATIVFGLGLLLLVIGAIQSAKLTGKSRYIAFLSTLLFMIAPTILSGWALYGVSIASFGVFMPLALAISRKPPTPML